MKIWFIFIKMKK